MNAVLNTFARNLDYAERLAADVPEDRMAAQPMPGMNHPAWVLGHLAYYCDFAAQIAGRAPTTPTLDPKYAPSVDNQSRPQADPAAYPSREELLAALRRGHDLVAGAVAAMTPAQLDAPNPVERMRGRFPTVADGLTFMMTAHEAIHLGQLSAWRRAMGMKSV